MKYRVCSLLPLIPLLVLTSCGQHAHPAKFSSVSEGGFRPESSFREHGYGVKNASHQGVSNPVALYQWHSWQGVLTLPESSYGCDVVAVAVRDALNQALGGSCHDELTGPGIPNPVGKAGQLMYLKDGLSGEVHVWLFAGASEGTVSYAIFLREQKSIP